MTTDKVLSFCELLLFVMLDLAMSVLTSAHSLLKTTNNM